jgi:hypothetical protein
VSYGEIEIECGGRISGQVKPHEGDSATSYSKPAQAGQNTVTGSLREAGLPRSIGTNGSTPYLAAASSPTLATGGRMINED